MNLTPLFFKRKWASRFASNDDFLISEADLRELAADVADSFGGRVDELQLEAVRTTVALAPLITGDTSLTLACAGALLRVATASTITVPAHANVPFAAGTVIELVPTTASVFQVLADAPAGVTILAATGNKSAGAGLPLRLVLWEAPDYWLLTGGAL